MGPAGAWRQADGPRSDKVVTRPTADHLLMDFPDPPVDRSQPMARPNPQDCSKQYVAGRVICRASGNLLLPGLALGRVVELVRSGYMDWLLRIALGLTPEPSIEGFCNCLAPDACMRGMPLGFIPMGTV